MFNNNLSKKYYVRHVNQCHNLFPVVSMATRRGAALWSVEVLIHRTKNWSRKGHTLRLSPSQRKPIWQKQSAGEAQMMAISAICRKYCMHDLKNLVCDVTFLQIENLPRNCYVYLVSERNKVALHELHCRNGVLVNKEHHLRWRILVCLEICCAYTKRMLQSFERPHSLERTPCIKQRLTF